MENQIESTVKRGRAYWFTDGFTEIAGGIFFLLIGGLVLFRGIAGQNVALSQFASTAVDIGTVKLAALLLGVLVIWWLKDRFTYPRTGYVQGQKAMRGAILAFLRNIDPHRRSSGFGAGCGADFHPVFADDPRQPARLVPDRDRHVPGDPVLCVGGVDGLASVPGDGIADPPDRPGGGHLADHGRVSRPLRGSAAVRLAGADAGGSACAAG